MGGLVARSSRRVLARQADRTPDAMPVRVHIESSRAPAGQGARSQDPHRGRLACPVGPSSANTLPCATARLGLRKTGTARSPIPLKGLDWPTHRLGGLELSILTGGHALQGR